MALDSIFTIAGQGMTAQGIRLNTVASNLANAQSASSSVDQVYRSRHPVFAAVAQPWLGAAGDAWSRVPEADEASRGVRVAGIVESDAPLERRYEPSHPLADEEGYVFYPNVNVIEQMADMIAASRAFEINVEMMQSAKTLAQRLLTLGQ